MNDGGSAIYMSCVVQRRESLGSIATKFGTTVSDLETVNGFGEATVDPGDILSIPIAGWLVYINITPVVISTSSTHVHSILYF